MQVRSLGQEDSLEDIMETHPDTKSGTTEVIEYAYTHTHTHTHTHIHIYLSI